MAHCHKCGREIPRKTGVYKVLKTGNYKGSNYYRNVNLCPDCAVALEKEEASQKQGQQQMVYLIVGVVVVGGALAYYMYFM